MGYASGSVAKNVKCTWGATFEEIGEDGDESTDGTLGIIYMRIAKEDESDERRLLGNRMGGTKFRTQWE